MIPLNQCLRVLQCLEAMMNRSSMREHVFKMIFSYEFDMDKAIVEHVTDYLEDVKSKEVEDHYMTNRVIGVFDQKESIDEQINAVSQKWNTGRMANVDLAILRLMVYEIQFDDDIPTNVAINEGVELAKKYGGDNSPKFVNGIIAKIVNR